MSVVIDQFCQAITAAGLEPPDVIHDDGLLHRFSPGGKRGDTAAYYVLYGDGIPAGVFGCWRAGLQSTWCAKSASAMTAQELAAHRQRVKAMRAQREADEAARQREEAGKAATRWQGAAAPHGHPYLARKGIAAHGIRQDGDALLIPLRDTAGTLHSLQTITSDGDKRFKGRMKGCYHAIGGKPAGHLVIAEGYATAASIHEATGWPVAVAFNAANLMPVAMALHKAYPVLVLVLAADDDHQKPGNPGLSAARQAALAVGGFVVAPLFPADRPDKATDFNDLATLAGLDAVRACFSEIEEAVC
jgi:putative DNA primase/helicase